MIYIKDRALKIFNDSLLLLKLVYCHLEENSTNYDNYFDY